MSLDPLLREYVACPSEDHSKLIYDEAGRTLTCPSCARVFMVKDGLPILLVDEAVNLSEGEG